MTNQRNRESFNAGAQSFKAGEARPTQVCCLFDLTAFRAGWDDAQYRAENSAQAWDDVAVTLSTRAAAIHDYHAICMYTGRTLYRGNDRKAAIDACRKNGNSSSLLLCDGSIAHKGTGRVLALQ